MKGVAFLFSLALVLGVAYSQSIAVTSPNNAKLINTLSTTSITWTNTNVDTTVNVAIELWVSPGIAPDYKLLTIIDSASNTGSYSWLVNDYIPNGSTYYILVNNGVVSGRGSAFTIQRVPVAFIPTWPIVGSSGSFGSTQTVQWTTTGILPSSTFTFNLMFKASVTANPTQIATLSTGVANTGSQQITIPSTDISISSNYYIAIVWEQDTSVTFNTASLTLFQFPSQVCKTSADKYTISCTYANNTFPNFPASFSAKIHYTLCDAPTVSVQIDNDQSAEGIVAVNHTQTVSVNEKGNFFGLNLYNVTSANHVLSANVAFEACTGVNCFQLFDENVEFGTKNGAACPGNDSGASTSSVSALLAVFVAVAVLLF
eukprot:TRINITY_DN3049_c0_g1_i4.p1 TRINITY_DN3049_c0_g1~~TRINITY_DN3049_c0_g1_i4.p1  ORF type:complete len:372 (-),score=95.99 TRINITY_DN3049_c0_g1_i4:129-1244(-)